jgi:hypothetical protein
MYVTGITVPLQCYDVADIHIYIICFVLPWCSVFYVNLSVFRGTYTDHADDGGGDAFVKVCWSRLSFNSPLTFKFSFHRYMSSILLTALFYVFVLIFVSNFATHLSWSLFTGVCC